MDNLQNKEQLLLVDDDENLAEVLSRALIRRGYEVSVAHSGGQAVDLCDHEMTFDRAVLDLKLVNESGLALIPKLIERIPTLKIVVLTGYSSIATAVEAIKLGAVNYLCKPADADEVLAAFEIANKSGIPPEELSAPSLDRLEWEHIQKVLKEYDGNISATARALNMHRRTLQRKLNKFPVRR